MFAHPLGDGAELRPLEPWQAAEFAEHVDRVRADIVRYVPFGRVVVDEASARVFLQRYADLQAADGGRLFGIWVDGVLQGGTLFRVFDAGQGVCEAGVWLDRAAQGRGLVTTACRVMIDWAFGARGMARVEWLCDPANDASIAVARRLGMTLEGVRRKAYVHDGEPRDLQVWAVLDDEWKAAGGR
ncbi:GNAT family N-acetyltransferase [Actinomadura algeriensis]|uniref:RimJ/RimL family protein N-acetyltransferase n=1 Tax=Actinomadura algeriensis TaxID=1679523 RepID=A0ABR9JTA5_9ACTN|nr:GNAT family protein [Actinomadura algeriensis]MBE1533613.1 RimJ/RimL family protein N-acetyltransferase [Actinomadura algeriensis]